MDKRTIHDLVFFDENIPQFSEEPTPAERCIAGQPLQRSWNHFTSADGRFFAGHWEADPGCWKVQYTENEFCQIMAGRSLLRDLDGNEHPLEPGDNLVIPAGFAGEWEVIETTKKIYVIYQP